MRVCPKCKRKRRAVTRRKKLDGVDRWLDHCVECGAVIDIDAHEPGRIDPPTQEPPKRKRKWFETDPD